MVEILPSPLLTEIIPRPSQVLLLHAPAVDIRLPWARWHQPTGLLQIGAALQKRGCDVRFFDCLPSAQNKRIARRKAGTVKVEGYALNLWHFGMSWSHLARELQSLKKQGWFPEQVFVSCFTTS